MSETDERFRQLETEIERRLLERFAALRDEFDRLRLEADRRWAGFLTRFDQDFTGIVPRELVPAPPPPQAAPSQPAPSGRVSLAEIRTLDEGDNQVEVLRRFLDLCRRYATRAVLFVARSESLDAWKAVGFSDRGGNDEAMRRVSVPIEDGALRRILEGTPARLPGGNPLSRALSVADAAAVVVVPMVVREKVSGLVYADAAEGAEENFDPDAIALLTYLAGAVVDRLSTRRLRPSPSLAAIEEIELREGPPVAEESPAAEPAEEEPREFELATEAAPEAPPASFAAAPPAQAPAAPSSAPAPSEEAAAPESGASSSWQADVEPPPMPRGVEAPLRAEPTEAPQPATSTTTRRLAGPLAQADGDERREEARRFARLLVSEIKLYNERAVLEGRERKDLYQRLREDIDRSRQMYDERIPQDVRSNSNFFYEEMVRILADGRPEALGL